MDTVICEDGKDDGWEEPEGWFVVPRSREPEETVIVFVGDVHPEKAEVEGRLELRGCIEVASARAVWNQ